MADQTCLGCGKTYEEHEDTRAPHAPVPRMLCLGLKSGFLPRASDTAQQAELPPDLVQLYATAGGHRWVVCTTRVDFIRCIDCGNFAPTSLLSAANECTGEARWWIERQRLNALLNRTSDGLRELLQRVDSALGNEEDGDG